VKFDTPGTRAKPWTRRVEERGGTTKIILTVRYESREARDTATRSGMEHGIVAGYNRLELVLASFGANG
jgi:hypothetical protein